MMKEFLNDTDARMQKTLNSVQEDFAAVRAGRANAQVLDRITVEYYGTPTPLNQVATIASPDPRQLTIQPCDCPRLLVDCKMAGDGGIRDGTVMGLGHGL